MLQFFEQQALANAYNYSLIDNISENNTVCWTGVGTLWCPSDGATAGLKNLVADWGWDCSSQYLVYTSYAGNVGTFDRIAERSQSLTSGYYQTTLNQANGLFYYIGYPTYPVTPLPSGGGISSISPVRLASITDGTSNTFAFGERAHGKLSQTADADGTIDYVMNGAWHDGADEGSLFTSMYALNPFGKMTSDVDDGPGAGDVTGVDDYNYDQFGDQFSISASSYHPGGANFCFADGSVKFLKDTINTWRLVPPAYTPANVSFSVTTGVFSVGPPGMGVYQALSTRAGGEMVGSDAY